MKILALDTSTEACSAALLIDGAIDARFSLVQQRHSETILPMIESLLAGAQFGLTQLDALAFGRGPGSFTALRIGAGVVQGLAFGADLPVIPVSSLAALAQSQQAPRVLAAFDARMAQVYYGAYRRDGKGLVELVGVEAVAAAHDVALPDDEEWLGAGSGWDRYADELLAHLGPGIAQWRPDCHPHARDVALLAVRGWERGEMVAAENALPVYIRDEVAKKQAKRVD